MHIILLSDLLLKISRCRELLLFPLTKPLNPPSSPGYSPIHQPPKQIRTPEYHEIIKHQHTQAAPSTTARSHTQPQPLRQHHTPKKQAHIPTTVYQTIPHQAHPNQDPHSSISVAPRQFQHGHEDDNRATELNGDSPEMVIVDKSNCSIAIHSRSFPRESKLREFAIPMPHLALAVLGNRRHQLPLIGTGIHLSKARSADMAVPKVMGTQFLMFI
jgi:hypothetical protein